jgi:hypothetical protein
VLRVRRERRLSTHSGSLPKCAISLILMVDAEGRRACSKQRYAFAHLIRLVKPKGPRGVLSTVPMKRQRSEGLSRTAK